ncbi:MAG: glycosyltransferase family 4 protein [Armatimonadetes bacterium]|nr:glycosyltransferase family 4 protein [Armatimonadota bacterium]
MNNEFADRRYRVCLISTSPILSKLLLGMKPDFMGGAEVQQTLIVEMLKDIGCEVSALVHDFGQQDEVVTPEGLRLIKAYRPGGKWKWLLKPWKYPMWLAIKRADANLYYQRATGTMTGVLAMLCRRFGRPFVHATSIDLDLDGTKESRLNPMKRMVYRHGIRHAEMIVVQTDQQNSDLKRRFGREGFIIRNTFSIPEHEPSPGRSAVLWVGSFRDHKHPEMFLQVARRLPDVQFLMVGGAYHSHPQLFDGIMKQSESVPNIELTGLVPYDEVGTHFDRAALFVCTSEMEGFPNTFLQSWSRGIPVISTVDPDGLIQRYDLGRFCESLDDVVEAVRHLSSDSQARDDIGSRAREYVRLNHHPDAVKARYRELIETAMGQR